MSNVCVKRLKLCELCEFSPETIKIMDTAAIVLEIADRLHSVEDVIHFASANSFLAGVLKNKNSSISNSSLFLRGSNDALFRSIF